jgi:hypothetical protein
MSLRDDGLLGAGSLYQLIDGIDLISPGMKTVRFVSPDYSFGAFHVSALSHSCNPART